MRQFTPHQGRYGINPAQPHRNKGSVGLSKTSHQVTKVLIKGESLAEEEPASLCMESSSAQMTMHSSSAQVTTQSPENRKRAPAWTAREVLDLIAIWGEDSVLTELHSKRRNEKVFERISKAMMDKGHSRDSVQYRVKVKELRQAYQKTKEANGRSGAGPKTCRFYAELHAILGGCATSTPPLSVDSDVGVVITMAEDYADGEEYDEEADEDDLAESTQHSVSPNSHELFLTQTELASQPSQATIPDNEAMEGTSGECTFANIKHCFLSKHFLMIDLP
ncbi:uncharacterized protein ACDP82_001133 isoform 1-T1 [Pangshura tecta]